jgi:hypothetical protein
MAFKLNNPPYKDLGVPIYLTDLGDDTLGKANNNQTILINSRLDPNKRGRVIKHEMVHIDQFRRGDLDYDDKNVYWKGKIYPRSKMKEGNKNLPWEKEAYNTV